MNVSTARGPCQCNMSGLREAHGTLKLNMSGRANNSIVLLCGARTRSRTIARSKYVFIHLSTYSAMSRSSACAVPMPRAHTAPTKQLSTDQMRRRHRTRLPSHCGHSCRTYPCAVTNQDRGRRFALHSVSPVVLRIPRRACGAAATPRTSSRCRACAARCCAAFALPAWPSPRCVAPAFNPAVHAGMMLAGRIVNTRSAGATKKLGRDQKQRVRDR